MTKKEMILLLNGFFDDIKNDKFRDMKKIKNAVNELEIKIKNIDNINDNSNVTTDETYE